ncbi:GH25 family lysozyme [Sinorhizobium terangae]|uniref:GH25 family lysozyme n=1 Tax=Sinorhizobium terangae TaxID=110322 RepID=UPI0024B1AA82|nr:GH25 family lysozyme [Sinorhizobium terangae]WFU50709.1 GH25 family lysozyme [Sinorhizobium terangae]
MGLEQASNRISALRNSCFKGLVWTMGFSCRLIPYLVSLVALAAFPASACEGNDADVPDDKCKYFFHYVDDGAMAVDANIAERLKGNLGDPPIRSYALIVDNNYYPNFALPRDRRLKPAENDLKNLKKFFVEQKFNEIIVLENDQATKDNIRYFLEEYLPEQSKARQKRARIVFAYSGHGAPGNDDEPGSIVLSAAKNSNDSKNLLRLNDLATMLVNLSHNTYHFLALIGSCYSGGIFPMVDPRWGSDNFPKARGAHALSSTESDKLAYGLTDNDGSIFFDSLIEGVRSGWADPIFAGMTSNKSGATFINGGGIARFGPVTSYISLKLDMTKNPATGEDFPQVRSGSLHNGKEWGGAFFFLVPKKPAGSIDWVGTVTTASSEDSPEVALSTGSAIERHPEIKVFNAPDSYAIRGLDVSHWSGEIDWKAAKEDGLTFAYMKATEGGDFVDDHFEQNWKDARHAGLVTGAYHVVNFCKAAAPQFENIKKNVPKDPSAMPIAVDLEWYNDGPILKSQKKCTDINRIQKNLHELLQLIREHYEKLPVIFAHERGIRELIANQFNEYPLWLQDWTKDGTPESTGPSLSGANPWTIWQFAGEVAHFGSNDLDLNAFFGTQEQFAEFVLGNRNVALEAALQAESVK